jgi:hypothetical protein
MYYVQSSFISHPKTERQTESILQANKSKCDANVGSGANEKTAGVGQPSTNH